MKDKIHPEYGAATIQCACGNRLETRSTAKGVIQVDICSACHPFFTGKQKLIDTAGRIDRFKKKFGDKVVGTQKRLKPETAPEPVKGPAKKLALPARGPVGPQQKTANQEKLQQVKDKISAKK